jgi:hypothetical protein
MNKMMILAILLSGFASADNIDELEVLGAVMWYSKQCNNTTVDAIQMIDNKLKAHGLSEDPEFNDDISNGMNKAWLAGCARIKSEAIEKGYSEFLICQIPDFMDDDDFLVSGCEE